MNKSVFKKVMWESLFSALYIFIYDFGKKRPAFFGEY